MSVSLAATRSVARRYLDLPPTVHVLCFGTFLNRAGSFVMIFLTIYVSERLGYGISYATSCIGAFGAGSIVAAIVGGQLADIWGRRRVMLLSIFGGAGMLILLGQLQSRWGFLAAMFGFALLAEMYRPAASAMIGDVVDARRRPYAFGLMYISMNLGFALAPPIGGLLAAYSFELLFYFDALTAALFGLVVACFITETLPQKFEANSSAVATEVINDELRRSEPWTATAAQILRDTPFVCFCLSSLLTTIVFVQAFATLPLYVRQLGYTETQFGFLIAVNGILIVVLQLPLTHWLSRFNRIGVIMAGEALLAVGFGVTGLAHTTAGLLLCIVIWTLGEIAQAAFKQTVVADLSPQNFRGRYMGIFGMCHAVGLTIGAPLGGEVFARYGATVLWPVCAAVVLAALGLYGCMFARLSRLNPVPD